MVKPTEMNETPVVPAMKAAAVCLKCSKMGHGNRHVQDWRGGTHVPRAPLEVAVAPDGGAQCWRQAGDASECDLLRSGRVVRKC